MSARRRKKIAFFSFAATGLALAGFYYGINSRTFQFFGGIIPRVETNRKVVALTFDDGPTGYTPELIALLKQHRIQATFFLIGQDMAKNPDYVRQLAEAGHEIGNHTFSHHRMVFKSKATIAREVEKTDSLIRRIAPQREILFRPPYCKKFIGLPYYLHRHGRKTITWDVEPESYREVRKSAAQIARYTVGHTRPGSIILLHCMTATDVESRKSLDGLIRGLKERGFTFVTVSELLKNQLRTPGRSAIESLNSCPARNRLLVESHDGLAETVNAASCLGRHSR